MMSSIICGGHANTNCGYQETYHHMVIIEIQPAGNAVADREYDIQGTNAEARRALPFFKGDFDHIVAKQGVSLGIAPRWSKIKGQNA